MGAYQVSSPRAGGCRVWFFVTLLVCSKAPDEHRDDDPHKTECAFNDHHVLFTYAYFELRVAASRIGLATTAWVWGPNTPKKLFCALVSTRWPKSEAKASTRGANSWCSVPHSPLVVDCTVLDEGVSPLALDGLDESSF